MKNLKIYKSTIALLTSASILLLSGCTGANTETEKEKSCTHLTVYFEEGPITFKECEGYTINSWDSNKGGELHYDIVKDGKKIFSDGITDQYNKYEVYHDITDEQIQIESVQKSK